MNDFSRSHAVRCKIESLLLQTTNMACQIAVIRMTLSDLQGRLPIACLFECDFSYSYAALDKISADIERRALSLRRLRFLFQKVKRT